MNNSNPKGRCIFHRLSMKDTSSSIPSQARGVRPPGPKGYPFVGNMVDRVRDPLNFFIKNHQSFGDLVFLPMMNFNVFFISDPELIKNVLLDRETFIKGKSYDGIRKFIGDGILTSNGPKWVNQRKYLTPFFKNDTLPKYLEIFYSTTSDHLEKYEKTSVINLKSEMISITVENVSRTLFGTKVGPEACYKISTLVTELAHLSSQYTFRFIKLPEFIPTPLQHKIRKAQHDLEGLVDTLFQHLYINPPAELANCSKQEIREQIINLFLAGHETTATSLVWILWHLALDESLQDLCRSEVQKAPRQFSVNELDQQFPVLQSVIMECLRLYPPVWIIPRQVTKPTELKGYHLDVGDIVTVCPFSLGRSERHWESPNEFKGLRFLDNTNLNKFIYLPFSRGPRSCMGENFAVVEMIAVVSEIMRHFECIPISPFQPDLKHLDPALTLRPKADFEIKLKKLS